MAKQLTLGTATITERADMPGMVVLNWLGHSSFIVGEQYFGNTRVGVTAALRFCRERGLRVI